MWGRATLTIVVSSTTISWAVRITKRRTLGLCEAAENAPTCAFGQIGGRLTASGARRD